MLWVMLMPGVIAVHFNSDPIVLDATLIRSLDQGFSELKSVQIGEFDGCLVDLISDILTKTYLITQEAPQLQ